MKQPRNRTSHARSVRRSFALIFLLCLGAFLLQGQNASAAIFAPTEEELDAAFERSPQSVPDVRALPHITMGGKTYVQMGDMILLAKSYYGIESAFGGAPWTNGIVYYQFDADVSAQNRQNWRDAAEEWRSAAPALSFVESVGSGNFYIQIHNSTVNRAAIGMQGPAQLMEIFNWGSRFVIAHEIGHALGLIHEHQRSDRNSFVQINLSNVRVGEEHNFDMWSPPATSYGTYDFDSVMHYHQCAFTICSVCNPSCRTITVNPQYSTWQDLIGQGGQLNHLSDLDMAGMAQRYPGMTLVNDQCSGAITLFNGEERMVSTVNATSTGDPSTTAVCTPSAPISRGVWYKFTPGSNGMVTVSTCGSSYDTVLEVYTGSCGSRTPIACNDDNGPICSGMGGPASVTFSGTGGTTYLILAAGYNPPGTGGTLRIVASGATSPTPTATATATPGCTPTAQVFNDVTALPGAGWVQTNHSAPVGTTGWFQGNTNAFSAQSGASNAYIGANFNNTTGVNTISNWLLTPPITLQNGASMTFYTRTVDVPQFPDRLQVRMSTNGASANVGATATDVGDFTTLLLDINPTYTTNGYPNAWTQFTVTVSGIGSPTTGRLAFRYFVENGGPKAGNSDYIGIDTFEFNGCGPGPTPPPTNTTLGNISTRLRVLNGDNALIGGMIVTGTASTRVILRAIGPSLTGLGVPGALADPTLDLFQGSTLLMSNDDWQNSSQQAQIAASGFAPGNNAESAIIWTMTPGQGYTAIVRGKNGTTGVGVVEAYDLDHTVNAKLANISTRGFVDTGANVMIGGLIVQGQSQLRVVLRALGPSLPVSGAMGDPTLELFNGNGTSIAFNNNWRSDQEAEIIGTGIAPSNDAESAIVRNLTPGSYTAIVRGFLPGVALFEAYHIP